MRNAEAERFVRAVWAAFRREGIAGVLPMAADDAHWQPHSANRRAFRTTAEYREQHGGGQGGDHAPVYAARSFTVQPRASRRGAAR